MNHRCQTDIFADTKQLNKQLYSIKRLQETEAHPTNARHRARTNVLTSKATLINKVITQLSIEMRVWALYFYINIALVYQVYWLYYPVYD